MERRSFKINEYFSGNWDLFVEVVNNRNVCYMYDADGIVIDSATSVLQDFYEKTGIRVHPTEINNWEVLTDVAKKNNLEEEMVLNAESGWYDEGVLGKSRRYLYIKPVVEKTVNLVGADRNYILTARRSYLRKVTETWLDKHFPDFPKKNLLMRNKNAALNGTEFKRKVIDEYAKSADWVVLVDDSARNIKSVLSLDAPNVIGLNIPQGQIETDFDHERLFVIGRYPNRLQAMYPLLAYFKKAIDKDNKL